MLSTSNVRIFLFAYPLLRQKRRRQPIVVFDSASSALPAAAAVHTLHSCTNTSTVDLRQSLVTTLIVYIFSSITSSHKGHILLWGDLPLVTLNTWLLSDQTPQATCLLFDLSDCTSALTLAHTNNAVMRLHEKAGVLGHYCSIIVKGELKELDVGS